MATKADVLDDEQGIDETEAEPDDDQRDDGGDAHEPEGDDDEDVVTFGGEAARAQDEPEGMRNLRTAYNETKQRLKDAEAKLNGGAPEALPAKPTLEDHDYDEDAFEKALLAWDNRKRQNDDRARQQEEAARKQQERFDDQRRQFEDGWIALRVTGKDTARAKVEEAFDEPQKALLVKASRGNAALYLALASDPERLKKLTDLRDDPADFLIEAAFMAKETQVTRKPTTQPQDRLVGGAPRGRSDAKLERLEKEADRTGDRTALLNYRRELRDK